MFNITKKQKIFVFIVCLTVFGALHAFSARAQDEEYDDYVTVTSNSTSLENSQGTFTQYANTILKFSITLGALLAIIIIIIGGFEYVTAGGNAGQTERAKNRITQAILGLILILGSYLILYTINPDLINLNLGLTPLKIPPPAPLPTANEIIQKGTVTEIPAKPDTPNGQSTTINEIKNKLAPFNKTLVEDVPIYDSMNIGGIDQETRAQVFRQLGNLCRDRGGAFGSLNQFPGLSGISGSGRYYICVK